MLTAADKRATHRYLCFSLALLYNARQLVGTESLQQCGVQLSAAMLELEVGCIDEMLKPAQQSELLERTILCCALVDEAARLIVVFGMNDAALCNISVGLLETHHHIRSYWEATDQPGRLLSFRDLQAFADELDLQIIHHREGSLLWTHRPLGGDQSTPTVPARKDGLKTPGSSMLTSSRRFAPSNPPSREEPAKTPGSSMLTSNRRFADSNPPSREEPTLAPPARRTADLHSPMSRQAAMPDARREWLKRLSGDESLQETVGAELYAQLKLPAGMGRVATTSTFLTLIQMPDSVTGKLAGQGLRKSAGTRAALALLLAEMMLRFMAAKLVKPLRGPATMARECASHWLKLDSARIASRRFLSLTWMTRHIADGWCLNVRNKASLLADAITLANNHLATNWIQRLEMTRGTVDDGTLDGYTPLSATARDPLVPGKGMRFRNFLVVPRKPKEIPGTATVDHLANVQELSDESDVDEDEAEAGAPSGDDAKATHEQWLRVATTSLAESEARRLADQAGRNDLVQSCLTATKDMLTHRANGIDQDIAKVAAAAEESASTLHRGVQSALQGSRSCSNRRT